MNFLKSITASVKDFFNRDKNKNANKQAMKTSVLMETVMQDKQPMIGPYIEHPLHKTKLLEYTKNIEEFNKSKNQTNKTTIAFGDSLIDIPRGDFSSINEKLNFAISGSWAHNMEQMVDDISNTIFQKGMNIKYVIVGTLGGNPLLVYQDIDATINISYSCLNKIRKTFPFAKIIVYGLPPVYNTWAMRHSMKFESKIFEWVHKDDNAVFIPMYSKFGRGLFNLIPDVNTSSDGVHLSHKGVLLLDNLFEKAKSAKPKTIVD